MKILVRLISAALLICGSLPGWSKPVDSIETYGVYVAADKGYVKVGPYTHIDQFVDFKYLHEIPFVTRADQSLKVIVYMKDFNENSVSFELRPIDTIVDIREIKFDIKPLAKPDMYELTLDKPVKDGVMLHVHSGNFFKDNFGVIMLGDTQAQLVKYFEQKQLPDAPIVVQYLEDALVAFPNNAKLKELAVYWQKAANTEKDKKGYSYVEEKWQEYQKAEKLKLKAMYLRDLIGEINGYLNDHPDGYKADEAKQRKAIAEEKLKEYEKLL
ncbi:MAG: hypothetical protein HY080_14765 [Gammaproteobacteria bacterium]|nr:hypothetical protein [Gammaproteobacteria bacterium]